MEFPSSIFHGLFAWVILSEREPSTAPCQSREAGEPALPRLSGHNPHHSVEPSTPSMIGMFEGYAAARCAQ